jgi:hypothetical protein
MGVGNPAMLSTTTFEPPPSTLFTANHLDEWTQSQRARRRLYGAVYCIVMYARGMALYSGLLVKRHFGKKWNAFHADIDAAVDTASAQSQGDLRGDLDICRPVELCASDEIVSSRLTRAVGEILAEAGLPTQLSDQIRSDAFAIANALRLQCPAGRGIDVKLETFGENTCCKWHQDRLAGRAIVSYTGAVGTEYTSDANVNFGELRTCGSMSLHGLGVSRHASDAIRRVPPSDAVYSDAVYDTLVCSCAAQTRTTSSAARRRSSVWAWATSSSSRAHPSRVTGPRASCTGTPDGRGLV